MREIASAMESFDCGRWGWGICYVFGRRGGWKSWCVFGGREYWEICCLFGGRGRPQAQGGPWTQRGFPNCPIHPQRIAFLNVGVSLQRQRVDNEAHNLVGLLHHLAFGNPKCRLCHGAGEIVDLNAIELVNAHLNGVGHLTDDAVSAVNNAQGLIFKSAQWGVGLGKEIARTTGGVEELQRSQLALEGNRFFFLGLGHGDGLDVGKFLLQVIQKQRVNDFVDVLNTGVVHSSCAACFRVKGALKHGTEDGRWNQAPVEVVGGALKDKLANLLVDAWNLDVTSKHATVDVWECSKFFVHVRVAVFRLGV